MVFSRHFAALTGAGITLLNSLQLLDGQIDHPALKERVKDVAFRVERGYSLAESIKANSDIFPSFFHSMIEAGEAGGFLETALKRLALHLEKQYELEQKIRSATLYPKFIAFVAIVAVIFMLTTLLPVFAAVFENMGIEMPVITRLLLSAGNLLLGYWHLLIIVLIVAFMAIRGFLKTGRGRRFYDQALLYNPFFGAAYRKMITAIFCRTLATLLGSGIAMFPSLELAEKIVENGIYGESLSRVKEGIVKGHSLAAALAGEKFFLPLVAGICNVGEQTGNLGGMLVDAADFLEADVSDYIDRLGSMVEPVLILFMAGIVVLIALSVLLPMFEIYQMI